MGLFLMDQYNFGLTLIITIGYQLIFFVIAATLKIDKVTDLAGGTNFVALAFLTWGLGAMPDATIRQNVVSYIVIAWGVRLSGFLFYRILVISEDKRFDNMRDDWVKFLGFWIFQMLWVWIVSLPLTFLNSVSGDAPLNSADYIGCVLSILGIIIEFFADQTKMAFKQNPDNVGKWCNVGIWKYSRHPNYFGELIMWWGVFMSCAQMFPAHLWAYFTIISPLFTHAILFGLSGLPLLEKGSNTRFGTRADYLLYREETSILVPLPVTLYRTLPHWLKAVFLFEWGMYEEGLPRIAENENGNGSVSNDAAATPATGLVTKG